MLAKSSLTSFKLRRQIVSDRLFGEKKTGKALQGRPRPNYQAISTAPFGRRPARCSTGGGSR